MKNLKKLMISAFIIFNSYLAVSQDINGCDYLRELKVKRMSEQKTSSVNYVRLKEFNDFKEPFEDEAKNFLENKVMNIHFQTNKSDLTKNDSIDMNRYFMRFVKPYTLYEKVINFNIEGFADCRGDKWKNYELSNKRAESVANYLKKFYPNSRIYISAFGENESKETNDTTIMQKDRKVRIFFNEHPLKRAIDLCKAKWFLVDQSGSMNKDGEWNIAQEYYYPDSSRVCSFSKIIYYGSEDKDVKKPIEADHSYNISTERAFGNTCYYDAGNVLLKLIPSKSVLTSIINGGNNVGEDISESIIKSAKDKDVIINHVGINLDENAKKDFIKITDETGGKYYFLKRFN